VGGVVSGNAGWRMIEICMVDGESVDVPASYETRPGETTRFNTVYLTKFRYTLPNGEDAALPGVAYVDWMIGRQVLYYSPDFPGELWAIAQILERLATHYHLECKRELPALHPLVKVRFQAELWLNVARDAARGSIAHYPASIQVTWDRVFAEAWQRLGCKGEAPEHVGYRLDDQMRWVFGQPEGWGSL